jgi:hypothetical protein
MENHVNTRNCNLIHLEKCRYMNGESARYPSAPQNSPLSSALYHHTSVQRGHNLILERGILFLASTDCRFTLRWKTRDRVDKTMETLWIPVQISTTSLLLKLPTGRTPNSHLLDHIHEVTQLCGIVFSV